METQISGRKSSITILFEAKRLWRAQLLKVSHRQRESPQYREITNNLGTCQVPTNTRGLQAISVQLEPALSRNPSQLFERLPRSAILASASQQSQGAAACRELYRSPIFWYLQLSWRVVSTLIPWYIIQALTPVLLWFCLSIYSRGLISQPRFKLSPSDLQVKQQEFIFTLLLFSVNHDTRFSSWV